MESYSHLLEEKKRKSAMCMNKTEDRTTSPPTSSNARRLGRLQIRNSGRQREFFRSCAVVDLVQGQTKE